MAWLIDEATIFMMRLAALVMAIFTEIALKAAGDDMSSIERLEAQSNIIGAWAVFYSARDMLPKEVIEKRRPITASIILAVGMLLLWLNL